MKQSYCKRLQIDWQVSSEVNQQLSRCFRRKIREWGFSRRDCRPVEVKNVMWEVYVIWVTSTYFSRWLRDTVSDAIAICSEKAFKNSEIWVYMNSQMTLQRLNAKSNVNAKLFDDIWQNLINLRQNQCQIYIQWISSCKSIIENEKADQLIKSAAQELSVIDNMKAIIISFVKKQICKETKLQ